MPECVHITHFLVFPFLFQDRLILGSNCTYLFTGYPSERGADDWRRYDYDYFQSELAAAEGISLGGWTRSQRGSFFPRGQC